MRILRLALLLLLTGCVAPALDASDYRFKAAASLEETYSALQTARLAVEQATTHDLPLSPVEVSVKRAEHNISSVAGQFASVKPPRDALDELRESVLDLIDEAEAMVAKARIALQRRSLEDAAEEMQEAEGLAERIDLLSKELGE